MSWIVYIALGIIALNVFNVHGWWSFLVWIPLAILVPNNLSFESVRKFIYTREPE